MTEGRREQEFFAVLKSPAFNCFFSRYTFRVTDAKRWNLNTAELKMNAQHQASDRPGTVRYQPETEKEICSQTWQPQQIVSANFANNGDQTLCVAL